MGLTPDHDLNTQCVEDILILQMNTTRPPNPYSKPNPNRVFSV